MKEAIRSAILSLGADVCGFAEVGRFTQAPTGYSPLDLLPSCRSVIVFGIALPEGLIHTDRGVLYAHFQRQNMDAINRIALTASKILEAQYRCICLPLPADVPYESWDADRMHGRALLSVKHAAVLAGLGFLGENTLLIHPEFGNRLTPGMILTSLPLEGDAPCSGACDPRCGKCIKACPVGAIHDGIVEQKLCRQHAYGSAGKGFPTILCNTCRRVCPLGHGKR